MLKTEAGCGGNEWVERVGELRQYVWDVNEAPQTAEDVEYYIDWLAEDDVLDEDDRQVLRTEFERMYGRLPKAKRRATKAKAQH